MNPERHLALAVLLCAALISASLVLRNAHITGLAVSNVSNAPPHWIGETSVVNVAEGMPLTLDLAHLFFDADNDNLTFLSTQTKNLTIFVEGSTLQIIPDTDFTGERIITLIVSDGQALEVKRLKVDVKTAPVTVRVESVVEDAVNAGETVPVIIFLNDMNSAAAVSLVQKEDIVDAARKRIDALQAEVLENARPSGITGAFAGAPYEIEVTQDYETVPALAARLTRDALEKLKDDPLVTQIVLDRTFTADLTQSVPLIDADDAWNISVNNSTITGKNVSICVIDTGIDFNHSAFANKTLGGFDFANNDDSPQDDSTRSHGTHVAGIAAGNSSIVRGVAPDTMLVPVKVCDGGGSCTASGVLAGIDYCNAHAGEFNIVAISGSLGDNGQYTSANCPQWFEGAFNLSASLGIIPVFASGNNGFTGGVSYPACSSYAISAGSSSKADALDLFTNRGGDRFDVLAPGNSIVSAVRGGGTDALTGTSMSTPHVAGVIALIQQNQQVQGQTVIPFGQMRQLLKETGKSVSGLARIDALAAIARLNQKYILNITENSVINATPPRAKVAFKDSTDLGKVISCMRVMPNFVGVDSEKCPQYNKSARITLEDLPGDKAFLLRNDAPCEEFCQNVSFANSTLQFDVIAFTNYSSSPGNPNITLVKIDLPDPVFINNLVNYSITITNIGTSNASNLTLTEQYAVQSVVNSTQPAPVNGTNDTFFLGELAPNASVQVNVTMFVLEVANNTLINNSANISFINATGALVALGVTENTTVLVPPAVYNASTIDVNKTDSSDPVSASTNLSYALAVTSTGNGTAYNVTAQEQYPFEAIFISALPAPLVGTNDTFVLGDITNSTTIVINITVIVRNVTNGTLINNTVNVTFQNETSENITASASQSTLVLNEPVFNASVLHIIKTVVPDPVRPGEKLSYDIMVRSTGNGTAYNVTLNETYPTEVIFDHAEPSPENGTNSTFVLGNISAGIRVVVNITVNVSASVNNGVVLNNTANATFQNETSAVLTAGASLATTVIITPPASSGGSGGGGGGGGGGGSGGKDKNTNTGQPAANEASAALARIAAAREAAANSEVKRVQVPVSQPTQPAREVATAEQQPAPARSPAKSPVNPFLIVTLALLGSAIVGTFLYGRVSMRNLTMFFAVIIVLAAGYLALPLLKGPAPTGLVVEQGVISAAPLIPAETLAGLGMLVLGLLAFALIEWRFRQGVRP
jgi:hypothetical protein